MRHSSNGIFSGIGMLFKAEFLLMLLGLAVSAYLTAYHYLSNVPLACPNSGIINCQAVLSSSYAVILGLPTALYGALFFAALLALFAMKSRLKFYLSLIGVIFVVYLLHVEYMLGEICEYCTAVHVITVAIFLIELYMFQKGRG